jgi:flagellin-specific chaperone FliS
MRPHEHFDALFRALDRARSSLVEQRDDDAKCAFSDAYVALADLYGTLDHARHPEVAAHLHTLYDRCMERIERANLRREAAPLDEVVRVLSPVRRAV